MTGRHGARIPRRRRGDPDADAAAALRLSGGVAAAIESGTGADPDAGAGPPRGAAPNPGAAAPASPAAPGIKPDDPAAWDMRRGRRWRGTIWRTTPPSTIATQARKPRFNCQSDDSPVKPKPALNLLDSAPTYCCLGHCITRGISLRRQASILRLRGVARFGTAFAGGPICERPVPEFGAADGVVS